MKQRQIVYGLFGLIAWLAAVPANGQSTPVYGDPVEMAYDGRLRQALRKPVTLQVKDTPLSDVVADLQQQLGIQITFDQRIVKKSSIGPDTHVTLDCVNVTAREALKLLLDPLDLAWLHGEAILITRSDLAQEELTVRIYPVADLVSMGYGPDASAGVDYDSLIEMLMTTTSPDSWDEVGGPGSIAGFDSAGALVIAQTRAVHEEVEWVLRSLRASRDSQGLPIYDFSRALAFQRQENHRLHTQYQEEREQELQLLEYRQRTQPGPLEQTQAPAGPIAVQPWQLPRHHE